MTKQTINTGAAEKDSSSKAKSEGGYPKLLIGVTQGFSSAEHEPAAPPRPVRLSAAQATAVAGRELIELVRLPLDSVSSVIRNETGWQVTVNLVELSRIPHSKDVISSYDVTIGEEGTIDSYRRITRYTRDQLGDDS